MIRARGTELSCTLPARVAEVGMIRGAGSCCCSCGCAAVVVLARGLSAIHPRVPPTVPDKS
eukprot:9489364-Pyramimonas_sp.AAC.1